MEILCHGTDCITMEKIKITIIKRGEFRHQKALSGPKMDNFNSSDEELLECVIGKWKNGPPVTRKTKQMHCNENSAERFQSRQWFGSKIYALQWFSCSLHSMFTRMLPKDYSEKLTAYQHHTISMC